MSPPQACYIPRDLLLWVRFRGLGQTGNRADGRVQLSGRVVLSMPEVLGSILSPSINSKKKNRQQGSRHPEPRDEWKLCSCEHTCPPTATAAGLDLTDKWVTPSTLLSLSGHFLNVAYRH